MLKLLEKSLRTGNVTTAYPQESDVPADGFRGLPEQDRSQCSQCGKCAVVCPTKAIQQSQSNWMIDARQCIFCGFCEDACANHAIRLGKQYELATRSADNQGDKIFAKSVHIRHLDAGSCNGCDWEMVNLTGPVYDIQRLGFDFVASPRHADILMVTGPVTRNLEIAAKRTFEAAPAPKLVVAVGTCACSGGICGKSYASSGGVDNILPVDAYIPGCPPRPQALIDGLLKAVKRR